MKNVVFETISGPGGTGHYLDDHRCGGNKPHGGGQRTYRAELHAKDVVQALNCTPHGRAALQKWQAATTLYTAVNEMMAHLGCAGEIDTRHPAVDAVMQALRTVEGR